MDFDDTPEEAAYRAEARAWLEANARPLSPGERSPGLGDRGQPGMLEAAVAWQARKARAGWACISWPHEYGGRGEGPLERVIWEQEEAHFWTPPDFFTIATGMVGPMLMAHASEAQKARWLPRIASGEDTWCQLFSEPAAGSDLASLRTRAVRDGDGNDWVVDGQKIWSSGAHYAKWGILLARTDPEAAKHAGITYFVLDMASAGVEPRPIRQITGESHFNEVFLTGVRIPDANRISGVGNGWAVAITTLLNERSSIGAGAEGSVDLAGVIELSRTARDEQGPLIEHGGIRERIADLYVRTRAIELTSQRTLTAMSHGESPGSATAMGKLVGARMQQELTALGMELQGPAGALLDAEEADRAWQDGYLFAPGVRVAGGTDEILRNVIAERVLGLPPEPRVDKQVPFQEIPTQGAN